MDTQLTSSNDTRSLFEKLRRKYEIHVDSLCETHRTRYDNSCEHRRWRAFKQLIRRCILDSDSDAESEETSESGNEEISETETFYVEESSENENNEETSYAESEEVTHVSESEIDDTSEVENDGISDDESGAASGMESEDASDGNEGSEIENTDVKSELNTAIRKLSALHHCSI